MKTRTSIKVSMLILSMIAQLLPAAHSTEYVDTTGKPTVLGEFCKPKERLPDGRIMIFSSSQSDAKLLRERLIANGVTSEETLAKWLAMAADNRDCTNRAGLNCSAGKCSSGTCQEDKKGNMTGCACK